MKPARIKCEASSSAFSGEKGVSVNIPNQTTITFTAPTHTVSEENGQTLVQVQLVYRDDGKIAVNFPSIDGSYAITTAECILPIIHSMKEEAWVKPSIIKPPS
jgi:hypothetical protein